MAGGAQHKSFMSVGTLHHELNNWVTFDFEQSLHETNACTDRLVPCRCSTASRLAPGATSGRRVARLCVPVARVLRDGILQAFPSRRKATPRQFQAIDSRANAVASSGRESSSHP